MAQQPTNGGTKMLLSVLTSLVVIGVTAMVGFGLNETHALREVIGNHADRPGHPMMVKRMKAVNKNMELIRESQVDTRRQLNENGRNISRILVIMERGDKSANRPPGTK